MALRFYVGGTAGAKDGTLISNGDGSAPIVFDRMYPGASTVKIRKTIFIRADEGETWRDVMLWFHVNAPGSPRFAFISVEPDNYVSYGTIMIPYIFAVNKPFLIEAWAKPTDPSTPDVTTSIMAGGWQST